MAKKGSHGWRDRSYRLLGALLLSGVAVAANSQPAPDAHRLVASFVDARAVAVDPAGVVYVVEGSREAIVVLREGRPDERRLGGRGSAAGQFDGLADIDPTNGLILVVADAGNGRIQRFSREFLFLESLPVDRREAGADAGGYTSYRKQEQGSSAGEGRPIAVRTSHAEETFVLDADRQVVLKWDRERNFEREIGGYDAGEGALLEPVALALDQSRRTLYVLDAGRGAVMVYDFLGEFERVMAMDAAGDAIGLEVWGDELMVFEPNRVVRYHTRGHVEDAYTIDLGEPVVDMAWSAHGVYALTRRGLYRLDLP